MQIRLKQSKWKLLEITICAVQLLSPALILFDSTLTLNGCTFENGKKQGIRSDEASKAGLAGDNSQQRSGISPEKFIGKTSGELFRMLGRPSRVIKSDVTGGSIYLYTYPNQPHYLFELDPTEQVKRAVLIP